ncbi:MAG: sulfatase-like hydrolase/transferase [Opitutaceae bacterium]|nr:sulfatase-like hydrolase/transferase [Opitutaceae bacterium]
MIVPDDHRWDAIGYMQERIASEGRVARFPWFAGRTPGLDRLAREGVRFTNGFVTFSLCSPSRAAMLTGQYPHRTGVLDNETYFPEASVTYATLLRDAGYATAYFGKWHMDNQLARPGFQHVATFLNQGNYYGNTFYVNETPVWEDGWVDDVSTNYLLSYLEGRAAAASPFVAFIGFKTPHDNRTPPVRHATLFSADVPAPVPNLGVAPPFRPGANAGTGLADNRNYFRCLVGADDNIVRILDKLDALGMAQNTVVIYISDNGYYLGEHGLGDKRSAYEESMRVPFLVRYPAGQGPSRDVPELALNIDIAPTLLDLAGLPVPGWMQGRSLAPLLRAEPAPANWPTSFLFQYARDPAYPTSTPAMIAYRTIGGDKLVHYPFNASWDEVFDTARDPYELDNLARAPGESERVARLRAGLGRVVEESGFLRPPVLEQTDAELTLRLRTARGYHFALEQSADLAEWFRIGTFRGTGQEVAYRPPMGSGTDTPPLPVAGDIADYALAESDPVQATATTSQTLRVGANTGAPAGGRNAVLIFPVPAPPAGAVLGDAALAITVSRSGATYAADLYALGIVASKTPILRYHESAEPDAAVRLQTGFLTTSVGTTAQTVISAFDSGLPAYLRKFYRDNPGYAGGAFLFLRINPDADPGVNNSNYTVMAADHATVAWRPVLNLSFVPANAEELARRFYRMRFIDPGTP